MTATYTDGPDIQLLKLAQADGHGAAQGGDTGTPEPGTATHEAASTPAHGADNGGHSLPFYQTAPFWVAVAFVMLVAFFFKKVSAAITNGLDVRAAKIKATLNEARQLREDAQALLAEYQRKQRDALKDADDIIAHAKDEAKRMKAKAKTDMTNSIKRREQQALDRIAQAEVQATAEVRNLAVDLAITAAKTVMVDSLTAAKANALIDDSIKGLSGKLN